MPPQGRIVVNEVYCKACCLCIETCPQHVIDLTTERLNIKGYHPARLYAAGCTGCGLCATVCPEAAITVYRMVTEKQTAQEDINGA